MSNRPILIFGAFAVAVALIVYLAFVREGSQSAAEVRVDPADRDAQELFAENCGACHTLAAAGTDGVVGPNLDDLLGTPGGAQGDQAQTTYEANYGRVLNAIECGVEGRMPKGILQGEAAQEVAGFVAAYAGQLSEDQGPLLPADERETPAAQGCQTEAGAASPSPSAP